MFSRLSARLLGPSTSQPSSETRGLVTATNSGDEANTPPAGAAAGGTTSAAAGGSGAAGNSAAAGGSGAAGNSAAASNRSDSAVDEYTSLRRDVELLKLRLGEIMEALPRDTTGMNLSECGLSEVAACGADMLADSGVPGGATAVKAGRKILEMCQAKARARQDYPTALEKLRKIIDKALKIGSGMDGGLSPGQYAVALKFNAKFTATAIPTPEETLEFIKTITIMRANRGSWKTKMQCIFNQLRPFMPEMGGGHRKTRRSKQLRRSRSSRRSYRK